MTSKELRKKFLDFFQEKGHKIVPSSSLLPADPSVLFTTAGMQQFKQYFLGEKSPYGQNICSCQKCFRTSDIDEVGDESHLTFLEMLGNFSFNGYFKEEAIKFAFQFLFEELKLPLESAFFTVFEGDENIPEDKKSISFWKNLGIPENKIKKLGKKDNFWGPTGKEGPCGPTTEIHINGVEVWNLVFNEYYQDDKGKLIPLKQKGIDTGMGLERLAMVVQKKNSVFETDLFLPIINEIPSANEKAKRIISDHIKGAVFLKSKLNIKLRNQKINLILEVNPQISIKGNNNQKRIVIIPNTNIKSPENKLIIIKDNLVIAPNILETALEKATSKFFEILKPFT